MCHYEERKNIVKTVSGLSYERDIWSILLNSTQTLQEHNQADMYVKIKK